MYITMSLHELDITPLSASFMYIVSIYQLYTSSIICPLCSLYVYIYSIFHVYS